MTYLKRSLWIKYNRLPTFSFSLTSDAPNIAFIFKKNGSLESWLLILLLRSDASPTGLGYQKIPPFSQANSVAHQRFSTPFVVVGLCQDMCPGICSL